MRLCGQSPAEDDVIPDAKLLRADRLIGDPAQCTAVNYGADGRDVDDTWEATSRRSGWSGGESPAAA